MSFTVLPPHQTVILTDLAGKDELAGDTISMQYSVMCDLDDKMDLLSFTSVLKRVGSDSTYVPQNVQGNYKNNTFY